MKLKLAAALLAATAIVPATALAADIPEIIDVPQIIEAPKVAAGGAFYLRGSIGVAIDSDAEIYNAALAGKKELSNGGLVKEGRFLGFELDEGAFVSVGAGYRFNDFFRVDATAEIRGSVGFKAYDRYTDDFSQFPVDCTMAGKPCERQNWYDGDVDSKVFLANAYAELGGMGALSPFIGAGIGMAHHTVSGMFDWNQRQSSGSTAFAETTNTDLAYAFHAGLGYQVNEKLSLELAYRYANLGDAMTDKLTYLVDHVGDTAVTAVGHDLKDIVHHDLSVGMRWEFGGHDYVEPLPPIHVPQIPYKH